MFTIKDNVLRVLNPSTGQYAGVSVLKGESTYDIARAQGYTGTEEEFLQEHVPDEMFTRLAELESKIDNISVSGGGSCDCDMSGSTLDGITLSVTDDHLWISYDDSDGTSHTGTVNGLTFSVTEDDEILITY